MGGQGYEQHRDVGDGAEIARGRESPGGEVLHADGEEPGEDPFHRRPFPVKPAEAVGTIGDLGPDIGGEAKQVVAALLL